MKDGRYAISFSAGSHGATGTFQLHGDRGCSRHGGYEVDLQFAGSGPKLTGTAVVAMEESVFRNAMIPRCYAVSLTGAEKEDTFSLIGIGPLGLIVELSGRRTGDA